MYRNLIFMKFLFICHSAAAIVNIEAVRPQLDELGHRSQIKFDLGGNAGNIEKFRLGLSHSSVWSKSNYQNFVLLSYNYGESFKIKNMNKSFLHLRHVRPVKKNIFWEFYGQSQTDEFKRLDLRVLGGAGGRWEAKTNFTLWAVGAGAFYSREKIKQGEVQKSEREVLVRGNFYVSMSTQLKTDLSSVLAIYFQPKVNRLVDHHSFVNAMLKAKWSEDLAFALEAELTHDSHPPATVKKMDITYTTSLIWKL